MDLNINRKNALEYLKEFKKIIPIKKSLLGRKSNVDTVKLDEIKDKINLFYEREILISPMSIDKNSINILKETVELIQQFPQKLKPDIIIENEILEQTRNSKNTRIILLPNIVQNNTEILENYDKMISYYLLMGGDNPIKRFSKIEMHMKQYGVKPDIGVSIMKYGNEITVKLEEIAMSKQKSPIEWEYFKDQVLHSFMIAEKIGNRVLNPEAHKNWEDRLIRLGILERRFEKENEQKQEFKEPLRSDSSSDKDGEKSKQKISLELALQKNATQMYINTGMVPLGYKKDAKGNITRIQPSITTDNRAFRLSATRNIISDNKNKTQRQSLSR